MKASIIKVAGLVVVVAALSAPVASAMRLAADGVVAQSAAVAPNDRAGAQGIGQTSDSIGMGGQYGANLIKDAQGSKKRDLQNAKSFTLPLAPDDRAGTSTAAATAVVIPYLSQGAGVNAAQFNGSRLRPDDRAGARPSVPTSVSTPVAPTGDGFSWGTAGIGAAGFAALALLIGLLVVLGRRSRHEGVAVS